MKFSLSPAEISELLGDPSLKIVGDGNIKVSRFSAIANAGPDSLSFCKYEGAKGEEAVGKTEAGIVICPVGLKVPNRPGTAYILAANPRLSFGQLLSKLQGPGCRYEIHPSAVIGENCRLGKILIGPNVVVGNDVEIGDGSIICPNSVIGDNVKMGNNVLVKSGAVIGQKGFGFERDRKNIPVAIPHAGSVSLGNDVEIGANTVIVRGTIDDTVISDHVKIDDNAFVAHNAQIGERTCIAACCEISGSVIVGEDCFLGPNSSIIDHAAIGDNVFVGIGAVVIRSVPSGVVVAGNPARILRKNDKPIF